MRFVALRVLFVTRLRARWVSPRCQKSMFPPLLPRLPALPSPVPLRVRVHPLMRAVLFRVHHRSSSCTAPVGSVRLPWGFALHRDIKSRSPLFGRFPMSCLGSVLSVSHALDGFLLRSPCRLISSCSHVRDSLFRGCFPLPGQHGSSPYYPLVSLDDVRLQSGCPNCPAPVTPTSGV